MSRPRYVIAGGAGAVGRLFAGLLSTAGVHVVTVDRAPSPAPAPGDDTPVDAVAGGATVDEVSGGATVDEVSGGATVDEVAGGATADAVVGGAAAVDAVVGDITAVDAVLAAELAGADVVLLAVPEPVALAALEPVTATLSPGALLVDTLSVKSRYAAAAAAVRSDVELLGLNPMFAPALGFAGRPVAAVELRGGPRGEALLRLLSDAGARVVRVTADRHDRLAAATQALTHAAVLSFGAALAELGVTASELTALAPPPHAALLALLARIAAGTPEVYWDVQSANPFAETARAALSAGTVAVNAAVGRGETEFGNLLSVMQSVLGDQLPDYNARCARMFATP